MFLVRCETVTHFVLVVNKKEHIIHLTEPKGIRETRKPELLTPTT